MAIEILMESAVIIGTKDINSQTGVWGMIIRMGKRRLTQDGDGNRELSETDLKLVGFGEYGQCTCNDAYWNLMADPSRRYSNWRHGGISTWIASYKSGNALPVYPRSKWRMGIRESA